MLGNKKNRKENERGVKIKDVFHERALLLKEGRKIWKERKELEKC